MDAQKYGNDDCLAVYDAALNPTAGLKNLWRECAAFMVCGGPSLKELPYHKLAERGVVSLGMNNVAGLVPVNAFTFNDPPEKFHHCIWRDPKIIKLIPKVKLTHRGRGTTREKLPDGSFKYLDKKTPDYPNVWAYDRRDWHTPEAFLTEPSATQGNNNKGVAKTGRQKIICSFFMGLRLLHYLGCRRVYLLGVDFWMDPSKAEARLGNYAFGEHRDMNAVHANNNLYAVANEELIQLRPILDQANFSVFNCNELSRLRAFDYVPFDEALDDCRNGVPEGELDLADWYVKGERAAEAT